MVRGPTACPARANWPGRCPAPAAKRREVPPAESRRLTSVPGTEVDAARVREGGNTREGGIVFGVAAGDRQGVGGKVLRPVGPIAGAMRAVSNGVVFDLVRPLDALDHACDMGNESFLARQRHARCVQVAADENVGL